MPPRRKGNDAVALPGAGAGHIDALPDGVLHHILGFVDAQEAVTTCILARRWRHLWKSATALRLFRTNLSGVPNFMEHLLLLRGCSPFDTFHLCFPDFEDDDVLHVNLWIRHALLCKVGELILSSADRNFPLDDLPLISQNLRSLELSSVILENSLCDFSGCPSLEHVNITYSAMPRVKKISSKSVKRLTIRTCSFNENQSLRTRIYAPNLVSLTLDDGGYYDEELYRTAVLDSMPKLQEAFVRLCQTNADCCSDADESGSCGDVDCDSCYGIGHDNSCLLEGLSEAEDLKLIVESETFVFKRDLKQCPTFSKLRNLFLNDYWCVAPDFLALTCIFKHSPILEKLGLQFSKGLKDKFRIKGSHNPMELSAATKHLKALQTVEIKCVVLDKRIIKLVKFLSTFDICFRLDEVEILEE